VNGYLNDRGNSNVGMVANGAYDCDNMVANDRDDKYVLHMILTQ
jgi:hypothetical protein